MRLLIAEKPSVARDIAKVLGVTRKHDGYLEGQGWLISWCVGHLVELIEPHEYNPDWKRWSLPSLPMVPEVFRLRPVKQTEDQFRVVARLLNRPDLQSVVNACDAGREGELIFRYVYALSGSTLPIERLWISSMTDQAILEGLQKLRGAEALERLYDAARSRSEADWLVGLNATRAITVRSRQGQPFSKDAPLYSVGRVQTPTLALLVDRELEIRHFKPKDYWQLQATFTNFKGNWVGKWFRPATALEIAAGASATVDKLETLAEAERIRAAVEGKEGKVIEVEQKRAREPAPMLFDLTRLQRTANKRYGLSAARTLEIAQALYERHKLLTYPRTDSTHLSTDMVPGLKSTIKALNTGPYAPFADKLLQLDKLPIHKRFVDDKKVSDHHAIIPTPNSPRLDALSYDEQRVYDLVVRRFLGVFFPDAVFDKTRVVTEVEHHTFVTRGKVLIDVGWREVAGFKDDEPKKKKAEKDREEGDDAEDEEEDQGALPPLKKGDPALTESIELLTKQTQPPPRYTEATLLAAMEGAGRFIEEEELQQAMKDTGLGTPATRASIIETLLSRGYMLRKGKALVPTEKGIRLIAAIPVESLRSPQLTGEWEARLARMARGEYPADQFRQEVVSYVREVVDRIKRARPIEQVALETPASEPEDAEEAGTSRGAGRGERSRANATGSGQTAPEEAATDKKGGKKEGKKSGKKAPAEKKAASSGEKTATEKKADAKAEKAAKKPEKTSALKTHASDELPEAPEGTIGPCPRCQGPVIALPDAYACMAGGRGCGYRLRTVLAGKALTASTLKKLLEKGQTPVIKGFISPKSGVKFDAALHLKPDGGIGFTFQPQTEAPAAAPAPPPPAPQTPASPRALGQQDAFAQTELLPRAPSRTSTRAQTPATPPPRAQELSLFAPRAPETRAPETRAPETRAPETRAPETRAPETRGTDSVRPLPIQPEFQTPMPAPVIAKPPPKPESSHPIDQILSPTGISLGTCPLCGKGQIITGRKAWGCSRWKEGCGFLLGFQLFGRELTEGEARRLVSTKRLGPLKGLTDQNGNHADGTLLLQIDARAGKCEVVLEPASKV